VRRLLPAFPPSRTDGYNRGMPSIQKITPCLWFDDQGEEAAKFYVSIFKNAKITDVARYPAAGQEIHGKPAGSVMTVAFELDGHSFTALNGGPHFKFNEAISLQVMCDTQAEVDYFWEKLGAGGDERSKQCGWLKDKFGLSWQIVPRGMEHMMSDPDPKKRERAFAAMLKMKKLDIAELERAFAG
jgi:predicted 3-demethylubiquinone-9 3-methyltransferase (glyoxalase superfamily)